MSPTKIIGLLLLLLGSALVYFGLHSADSLFLLQSSLLHFFEHMQMLWSDMPQAPRIYLAAGALSAVLGLLLLLFGPRRKHKRSTDFL